MKRRQKQTEVAKVKDKTEKLKALKLNNEPPRDRRVTAPLLSWQHLLAIFCVVYILILVQSFILVHYSNHLSSLISILVYYLLSTGVLLAVLFGLFWRYVIGKPLRRLSIAARDVASGDFTVQVEPTRKDGRLNELDVFIEDFNTMTKELAANEMLKSDFVANVSHEIKTPLAIIQSYTQALKDGTAPPEQREQYLDTVITAARDLNSMITNILKLNKLENQQIFPTAEVYQLGEQLRRCALLQMEQWEAKGIDFSINVVDVLVRYDQDLLDLVWNNLLSNAVKFTPTGGRIRLESKLEGDQVVVRLIDNGCGMDEATQKRIFEKFYQGDPSHAVNGNGLGLALAKKVIDIVGGQIEVQSRPGEGSAFTVRLSVAAAR